MDHFWEISFFAAIALFLIALPVFYAVKVFEFLGKAGKKVGPAYWGVYLGQTVKEATYLKQIQLRKASLDEFVTAGSSVYSKGKAVKSLRR
jgi:hypothetical protein